MKKRIDVSKYNLKDWRDTNKLRDELKDNLYYNQTWVWCESCNKRHRLSSGIPYRHSVKPMPIKCEVDGDHCWKSTGVKKRFGIEIANWLSVSNDVIIMFTDAIVVECVICGRKGLHELTFITHRTDITDIQLKELNEYIQSIKDIGIEKLNEMSNNINKIVGWIIVPEFNIKIREIQNIQDYVIIHSNIHNKRG